MKIEIGKDLDIAVTEDNLTRLDYPNRINVLFGIRKKLFAMAVGEDGEYYRDQIYQKRDELAILFRNHGGERHAETAQIFADLENPDDILRHIPQNLIRKEPLKEVGKERPFAFFVFGKPLNREQREGMKKHINNQGRKAGRDHTIGSEDDLLYLLKKEVWNKPIYITSELNERVCMQLAVMTQLKPDLLERLFILTWDDDKPNLEPLAQSSIFQQNSSALARYNDADIRALRLFIFYKPCEGDMFNGVITKVTQKLVFVKILPGMERPILIDDLPNSDVQLGDFIPVTIVGCDHVTGRPIISAYEAKRGIRQGEQPLFAKSNVKLLTGGS